MNGASWGGSEELWYKTALYLARQNCHVSCAIYAWGDKEERLKDLEAAGCGVYRLANKRTIKARGIKKILLKKRMALLLKKQIAALPVEDYDITVINQGGFEVYTHPWKNFYQRLHAYALIFHSYDEQNVFSPAEKYALKCWIQYAALNLLATKRIKEVLQTQVGTSLQNASVIINPITFKPPVIATTFPPLFNNHYLLAVFAALDVRRKAQDKLIKVLSAAKWRGRPWRLYLYGDGDDKKLLQEMIDNTGLREKVFLKGHTQNVAAAMQEIHLVLQITNVDAMPLSVVEAMAMARPLVVSGIGDMPLWVQQNINGWVCNTDESSIDAALENAWTERQKWEEMGKESFRLFKQRFPESPEAFFLQQLNAVR